MSCTTSGTNVSTAQNSGMSLRKNFNNFHTFLKSIFFFSPLHCIEFTEELLEIHEAEAERFKKYLSDNSELFEKVQKRQEVRMRHFVVKLYFYTQIFRCGVNSLNLSVLPKIRPD